MKMRACVAMGGGPTRVINRTLYGVVAEAEARGMEVWAARHGIVGMLKEDFVPLSAGRSPLVEGKDRPGALIGSTRHKPDRGDCVRVVELFKKHDVHALFYIGGNDTSGAALLIHEHARDAGYDLRIFHVPKTIDNDLVLNDHAPGYGSAARFVAHSVLGDGLEVRSLPGIKVDVAMGRHAGWLTAAAALCKTRPEEAPHLAYLPERPKLLAEILADVEAVYEEHGYGVAVLSEGVAGPSGEPFLRCPEVRKELGAEPFAPILEALSAMGRIEEAAGGAKRDAFGNVQLSGTGTLADVIVSAVKIHLHAAGVKRARVRADTFGYLQRSYAGDASPVDESEAEMVGRKAVEYSFGGEAHGSVALTADREGGGYEAGTELVKLADVGGKTRLVPDAFITAHGNGVTQEFMDYARPLVGPLARG